MRGKLRVYLGSAPGVGKTYKMLDEAHRRVERGADVVIAVVETHGRRHTTALAQGLETVAQTSRAYPQAAGGAGRRARAHERSRRAAREALAGRAGPAGRRDRGDRERLGDRDNTAGVGLGLALARGLVEAMGGTLTPEETPGGGLTMVLALPAASAVPLAAVEIEEMFT